MPIKKGAVSVLRAIFRSLVNFYEAVQAINLSSIGSLGDSFLMLRLFWRVKDYTMVGVTRLKNLYILSRVVDSTCIAGDIVECGVYNGGSAAVMAYASRRSPMRRKIWLFDSFQGMPEPTEEDGAKAKEMFHEGWCIGDPSKLKEVFRKLGIPDSRIHIVKEWFQDTLPRVQVELISLLHIDADWYKSVKPCLEKFYDSVQVGGFIVVDDYGFCEGCRKAADEFIKERGLNVKLVQVGHTTAYYFQKVAASTP